MKQKALPLLLLTHLVLALGLAGAGAAQAAVEVNISEPVDVVIFNPCGDAGEGEDIAFTGAAHTLITYTINGNRVSGRLHFNPQGVIGEGLTTGAQYQAVGATQDMFEGSLDPNGQYTTKFEHHPRLAGQGPGDNLLIHEQIQVTINANGTVTAEFERISLECR